MSFVKNNQIYAHYSQLPAYRLLPEPCKSGAWIAGLAVPLQGFFKSVPAGKPFKFDEVGVLLAGLALDVALVSVGMPTGQIALSVNPMGSSRIQSDRARHASDCGFKVFRCEALIRTRVEP
jgi:hypothetical protein